MLGLGLFIVNGMLVVLELGMLVIVGVLMGVIIVIFGGVLCDIVCNEIFVVFYDYWFYVLCSFVGVWVLVVVMCLDVL